MKKKNWLIHCKNSQTKIFVCNDKLLIKLTREEKKEFIYWKRPENPDTVMCVCIYIYSFFFIKKRSQLILYKECILDRFWVKNYAAINLFKYSRKYKWKWDCMNYLVNLCVNVGAC